MSATANLEISFTKNVTIKKGSITDLQNRFELTNTSIASNNTPDSDIPIVNVNIQNNKIILAIDSTKVPQPGDTVRVQYTSGAIVGPPAVAAEDGALVDSSTGYSISDLVAVKTVQKSLPVNPSRPTIINGIVEHEAPKVVKLTFTNGRNISQNSTESTTETNDDGGYGLVLSFSKGTEGAYSNPSFSGATRSWNDPAGFDQTLSITTAEVGGGEFQKGMTINVTARNEHIADQFDLSLNLLGEENYVTFPVTNNIKQINVDNAYISNIDPSAVIIYFKAGDISGVNMDSIDLNAVNSTRYKVFMDASGTNALYDVSGVKSISYNLAECNARGIPSKYQDVTGIRYELQAFPFKYNNGGNGNIKIMYNLNSGEGDAERIRDGWGNECFNSGYDTKAVTSGIDLSCIPITSNMIKGVNIKSANGAIDISGVSGEDLSYNIVLSFVTEDGETDISASLLSTDTDDWAIKVGEILWNPDGVYEISDPSRIVLYVDYSANSFEKIINKGDNVTVTYQPFAATWTGDYITSPPWPTTIKDEYGNYVFANNGSNSDGTYPTQNSMDLSGNLKDEGGVVLSSSFNVIELEYNTDVSLNRTEGEMMAGNDGFTLTVDKPEGVEILELMKNGTERVDVVLNKQLYKTSTATLSYSNTSSTIRSYYGFKLNNESAQTIDTASVVSPGETFQWGYIQGKRNEFGIIDLSFNPPIDTLGNGDGFKYAAGYSTMMSGPPYDLSTNGFVDISSIDVSLIQGNIRLNTGYNDATDVRGFSRRSAEGGSYNIAIKYVGPDVSDNRPSGTSGYLPDFQFNIADVSNSILDPSCNPDSSKKATAVVRNEYPNVVYIALQQPIDEDGTINFYDISQINIFPSDAPKFVYDADVADATTASEYETTNISTETGLALNGHTTSTKWIKATFAVDLSSVDLSLNYPISGGIRDQNGGMLRTFSGLDISSNIKWITLGSDASFETGGGTNYPYIRWRDGAQDQIYIRWDPNFSDFDSTPLSSYKIQYTLDGTPCEPFSPDSQAWVNESGVPGGELTLRLGFWPTTEGTSKINPHNSTDHKIKYTKPVGVQQTGRWGGLKLGTNPRKWLKSFPYQTLNIEAAPPAPTMTITATADSGVVNDGDSTSDPSLNLTFTSSSSTSDFVSGDITVGNGAISNFTGSGTTYTATFTPDGEVACTIDVAGGAYTSQGVNNTAATQFNWTKTSSGGGSFAFQASSSEWTKLGGPTVQTALVWEQDISSNLTNAEYTSNAAGDFRSQFTGKFIVGGVEHELSLNSLTYDGTFVSNGRLVINWVAGQFEMGTVTNVDIKYTKEQNNSSVRLVNSNEDEADSTTGFETIDFQPLITWVTVTNAYPKRLYFTTFEGRAITNEPLKNDFKLSNLTSNSYGTVDNLAGWVDVSSVGWDGYPTASWGDETRTSFYIEGDKEWQFGASGSLAYSGTALYDLTPGPITNNVETPFYSYPGPGGAKQSWINNDEPNSVYMGFRFNNGIMRNSLKEGNWAPDATYNVDRINKTKNFKFVTTNEDEPNKINIIDVSRVSIVSGVFVDTASFGNPEYDISMVKFDLSRNSNDISNVDNPYSFTSRDNIHMWWDYSGFADAYRFSDSSGNEIFDSSANVQGINTNYNNNQLGNDMSGNVADTTSSNLTGRWDGTPPNYFGALKINNNIIDISMVGAVVEFGGEGQPERLDISFNADVTFNSLLMTDISASDWQVDISGDNTTPANDWSTLPDGSKNNIIISSSDDNMLQMTFSAQDTIHHGDEIRISLLNMTNKPLNRQYIDICGNKLIPYNIQQDGDGAPVINNLS